MLVLMIRQIKELSQQALIFCGAAVAGGILGFGTPLLFDRDVGGALGASILGNAGLALGAVAGVLIIRRDFD